MLLGTKLLIDLMLTAGFVDRPRSLSSLCGTSQWNCIWFVCQC